MATRFKYVMKLMTKNALNLSTITLGSMLTSLLLTVLNFTVLRYRVCGIYHLDSPGRARLRCTRGNTYTPTLHASARVNPAGPAGAHGEISLAW